MTLSSPQRFVKPIKIICSIMNNHPFYSTNTNIYDESFCNSTPTNLYGQNVIVSQEQQRKLFDSLNTAVVGFPSRNAYATSNFVPGSCIQAGKQFVPGGVQFFFMPQHQVQQQPQRMFNYNPTNQVPNHFQDACFSANSLEQQMAMNSLTKHGLESLEYQQQLSGNPFYPQYQQENFQHPFQLKFHQNVGTSTNLFNVGSKSTPDFGNMGGVMQMQSGAQTYDLQSMETNGFDTCRCMKSAIRSTGYSNGAEAQYQPITSQNELPRSVRKLVISKPPQPFTGHVVDVLDETCEPCKKKVSFSDEIRTEKLDQTGQMSPSNDMNNLREENASCPDENLLKRVDQSEQASFPCDCSVGNNSRCETSQAKAKPKRLTFAKRRPKSAESSESGSSGSEKQKKPKKTKRKKNKTKPHEDEWTTSESE